MARGRTPKTIPTVERKIQIPEKLDAQLQLLLFSGVDGRVPYGALTKLVVPLLEDFVRRMHTSNRAKMMEGTDAEAL